MPDGVSTPNVLRITPNARDVEHLLKDYFYQIPAYQREYAWEATDHVERLLDDLTEHHSAFQASDDPHYFLGSMVVWGAGGDTNIIDGQQRLTTLWLLMCALRDVLKAQGQAVYAGEHVSDLVMSKRDDGRGNFTPVCRIRFLSPMSNDAIQAIERDGAAGFDPGGDGAAQRMIEAYIACKERLVAAFDDDPSKVKAFFSFLKNRVDVVMIDTPSEQTALQVFWTMNARGEDLDALDLAKTILMTCAGPEHYTRISRDFKDLRTQLEKADRTIDPATFLVYAIRASCDVTSDIDWEGSRPDRVHKWLEENKRTMVWVDSQRQAHTGVATSEDALAYLEMLKDMAVSYGRFYFDYKYRGADAPTSPVLVDFKYMGKSYRQHLVPLLAARFLPSDQFDRIADSLEDVLFVVKFTGSITRDVEKKLVTWAKSIRALDPASPTLADDVSRCIKENMGTYLAAQREKFSERFLSLSLGRQLSAKQLRYTYAKLAQWVDLKAKATPGNPITREERMLSLYWVRGDVEHILPGGWQEMPDWHANFDKPGQITEYLSAAGNLTWLEKDKNRYVKNRYFCDKQPVYATSAFCITKDLGQSPLAALGPMERRAAALLGPRVWYNPELRGPHLKHGARRRTQEKSWTTNEIEGRSKALLQVALQVWGMTDVAGTSGQ